MRRHRRMLQGRVVALAVILVQCNLQMIQPWLRHSSMEIPMLQCQTSQTVCMGNLLPCLLLSCKADIYTDLLHGVHQDAAMSLSARKLNFDEKM